MAFLPDTNVVIAALAKGGSVVRTRAEREIAAGTPVFLSAIVLFELYYGSANSARRAANEGRLQDFLTAPFIIAPFEAEDAEHAGDIRAHLRRIGRPIGPYDLLIAGQARRRDAVLVTANVREFGRVPGLRIENWAT